MTPTPEGYRIIKNKNSKYQIQSIYDLFHLNEWHNIGPEFDELVDATKHAKTIQDMDLIDYERCIKNGCSFPYND